MKAYHFETYGSADVLQLSQQEKPTAKPDDLLIKVHAVSINPADWRLMQADPFFVRFETGLLRPKAKVLGGDLAGEVVGVGSNVTQFQIGDRVYGDINLGGFAEFVAAPANHFAHMPANLTYPEAAAIPKAAITALQAVRDKGQVQPGQTVLINGASGGVGVFAVQMATALGGQVTAVCSGRNAAMVQQLGAVEVIDYTQIDFTQSGHQFDVLLDLVGNLSVADYQRLLTPTGRGVAVGFTTLGQMMQVMLRGGWLSRGTQQSIAPMNAAHNQKDMQTLTEMLEAGQIQPVIERCYPFAELPDAMRHVQKGHARGKIVVSLDA